MRRWIDSLAGRTLALLVSMTLVILIGSAWLLQDERKDRFEERSLLYLLDRVTTLVWLLQDAGADERERIIGRFSHGGDEIGLSSRAPTGREWPWRYGVEHMIHHKLRAALGIEDRDSLRVAIQVKGDPDEDSSAEAGPRRRPSRSREPSREEGEPPHEVLRAGQVQSIAIAVRLRDGTWVNIRTRQLGEPPPWAGKTLQLLGMLLVVVIASGLIIAWRMALPMRRLADAANRLGLGQDPPVLAEKGPLEVRQAIHAFNQMQERLQRHIRDRSRLLAAVSHDLRTPITTLRLRAEYIEDEEIRDKTLATLDEMESILSATLRFARDEAHDESARAMDLAALLQSLVDDYADLGGAVDYEGPERSVFQCRPVALKRALSNLIDNALKYGGTTRVSLFEKAQGRLIRIDDSGPGIPEADLETVFEPFFRLETSRSRETGGTGLGLSVARTIVHAHGGRIELVNRPEGGLRVQVWLPQ